MRLLSLPPRPSFLAVAVAALLLSACAPEPEFGACEPGVDDLSRTETVCP
ncbi:MAG: hypothetical protein MUE98_10880 [Rhodobacteraceae bacterium]|jgi:hypothetical protein|nr:hypothetical protein [Paracoccaceae bacterium]